MDNNLRRKNLFDQFGQSDQSDDPYNGLFDPTSPKRAEDPYSNLFNQEYQSPSSPKPSDGTDTNDILRMIDERYHPAHADSDKFSQLLNDYPQHEKPGIGRTIVAAMAGFKGGPEASQKVLDEPFDESVTDWKNRSQPMYEAANLERQSNANERQLLSSTISADVTNKRNLRSYETTTERNRIANERVQNQAEAAAARNRLMQYKADHPQARFDVTGPTVKILHSDNTVEDTGIDTGKMDEMSKIELQNEGRIEAARVQGTNQQTLETQRQSGRPYVIGDKQYVVVNGELKEIAGSKPGNLTRPGSDTAGSSKTENPRTKDFEAQTRMRSELELDPDMSKYIGTEDNGKYKMADRPQIGSKVGSILGLGGHVIDQNDLNEYDEVRKRVYPDYIPPTTSSKQTVQPTTNPNVQYAPTAGGYQGPPKSSNQQSTATGVIPKSPQEARQRAIGFLIENNMPVVEANIQHAIKTGRFAADTK